MISIIVPVLNEREHLKTLCSALSGVAASLAQPSELIFVDDCSSDGSYDFLKDFALSGDGRVQVIRLFRSSGQTIALQAGIDHAQGEVLVMIDADLQNDPAEIPRLLEKLAEGYDAVVGWRRNRSDPLLTKILPSWAGNMLVQAVVGIRIHDVGCGLRCFRKSVFDNIRLYGEMHRLLAASLHMRGFRIAEIEVSHNPRAFGRSHYGLSRVFRVFLDLIVLRFLDVYGTKPMYFFGGFGVVSMAAGGLLGIFVVVRTFFWGGVWLSPLLLLSLMLFFCGILFVLMGLLAELTVRVYFESNAHKILPYQVKECVCTPCRPRP